MGVREDRREDERGHERAGGQRAGEAVEPQSREEAGQPVAQHQRERDVGGRIEAERKEVGEGKRAAPGEPRRQGKQHLARAPREKPACDHRENGALARDAGGAQRAENRREDQHASADRVLARAGQERLGHAADREGRVAGDQGGEQRPGWEHRPAVGRLGAHGVWCGLRVHRRRPNRRPPGGRARPPALARRRRSR